MSGIDTTIFNAYLKEANILKNLISNEIIKMSNIFRYCHLNEHYWILRAMHGTLEKMECVIPNLQNESSYGITAITRNSFENLIWLKHFNKKKIYGLSFYNNLLNNQSRMNQQMINQFQKEIDLFSSYDEKEKHELDLIIEKNKDKSSEELSNLINTHRIEIDKEIDLNFTIYSDQAKFNGYGYQAYLIENKKIKEIQERQQIIEKHAEELKKSVKENLSKEDLDLIDKRWNWSERAIYVGMEQEYNYIYSFTSKFLHAEAFSLITEKNLSQDEIGILYKYLKFCFSNCINEINGFYKNNKINIEVIKIEDE